MPFTSADPDIAVTDKTLAKLRLYGTVVISDSNTVLEPKSWLGITLAGAVIWVTLALAGYSSGLLVLLVVMPGPILALISRLTSYPTCNLRLLCGTEKTYNSNRNPFEQRRIRSDTELGALKWDLTSYRPKLLQEGLPLILLQYLNDEPGTLPSSVKVHANLWVGPHLTDSQIDELLSEYFCALAKSLFGQNARLAD